MWARHIVKSLQLKRNRRIRQEVLGPPVVHFHVLPPCNIHAWKLDVQDEHSLHLWCNRWKNVLPTCRQVGWSQYNLHNKQTHLWFFVSCKMLLSCTKRFCRVFRPSSNTFLMDSKSVCAIEMVPPLRGARRKRILTPANKNFTFSTISRSAEPSSWMLDFSPQHPPRFGNKKRNQNVQRVHCCIMLLDT